MAQATKVNLGHAQPSTAPAKATPVNLAIPQGPTAPAPKATPVDLSKPQPKEATPPKATPVDLGDHRAAVAKMNPQHVHQLVLDAHAGKYGPQAQSVAQSATAPTSAAGDSNAAPAGKDYSSIFSGSSSPASDNDSDDDMQSGSSGRASMFGSTQGR